MLLTLIQTARDRRRELERFISSFLRQKELDLKNVQYIFVDQGENLDLFSDIVGKVTFKYIKTQPCSLSHARNLAIPLIEGKYVAYPDDDCWYELDTLSNALSILETGDIDGICGVGFNEKGELTSNFPLKQCEYGYDTLNAAISYTIFVKSQKNLLFDEVMGVGSPYNIGSGEETDYLLNLIEQYNYRIKYTPSIVVHHPKDSDTIDNDKQLTKAYNYARGHGYLFRKHRFPTKQLLLCFLRPLVGCVVFFIKGKTFEANRSFMRLKGRIEGYRFRVID